MQKLSLPLIPVLDGVLALPLIGDFDGARIEEFIAVLMDGIERAPQGYVIVKGGGVPAISVIGYNHSVNWRELVERLKRVTQDNVKPIVK